MIKYIYWLIFRRKVKKNSICSFQYGPASQRPKTRPTQPKSSFNEKLEQRMKKESILDLASATGITIEEATKRLNSVCFEIDEAIKK